MSQSSGKQLTIHLTINPFGSSCASIVSVSIRNKNVMAICSRIVFTVKFIKTVVASFAKIRQVHVHGWPVSVTLIWVRHILCREFHFLPRSSIVTSIILAALRGYKPRYWRYNPARCNALDKNHIFPPDQCCGKYPER